MAWVSFELPAFYKRGTHARAVGPVTCAGARGNKHSFWFAVTRSQSHFFRVPPSTDTLREGACWRQGIGRSTWRSFWVNKKVVIPGMMCGYHEWCASVFWVFFFFQFTRFIYLGNKIMPRPYMVTCFLINHAFSAGKLRCFTSTKYDVYTNHVLICWNVAESKLDLAQEHARARLSSTFEVVC